MGHRKKLTFLCTFKQKLIFQKIPKFSSTFTLLPVKVVNCLTIVKLKILADKKGIRSHKTAWEKLPLIKTKKKLIKKNTKIFFDVYPIAYKSFKFFD
jgi:hypothetical protein